MKREKFNALQRCDLIRHVTTGNSFVVVDSNGRGRVTIARTVDALNPDEWERCPDLDDPRFPNPFAGVFDEVVAEAERSPDPEAGLTMGEPESTPESPVDFRYRANADVGVIPAEVPADCLGAGVVILPKRCAEVGEAGQVYRKQDGEPESTSTFSESVRSTPDHVLDDMKRRRAEFEAEQRRNQWKPENVKIDPQWYAEADRVANEYAEARTTRTFSVTTTTSGADPLARQILKTAGINPTGEQVVSVASALEQLVASSRDVRPTSDIFFEAERKQVEQRERELTGNTTTSTSTTRDPASGCFANARPVESFAEVSRLIEHGVSFAPGSYRSIHAGAWGEWGNGRQGIGDDVSGRER